MGANREPTIQESVFACTEADTGRREQPRARFPQCRRRSSLYQIGQGKPHYRCGWQSYIDYPGILGTADPGALSSHWCSRRFGSQIALGTSFGASTENEVMLAEMITKAIPSIEKVRLVNSGTEATMSAIRLARAFTGRNKIIKFDGCYHGHVDSLLVKAGSGVATLGLPDSAGVQPQDCSSTISIPYNDCDIVQQVLESEPRGSGRRHHRAGCRQYGNRAASEGVPPTAAQADAGTWRALDL